MASANYSPPSLRRYVAFVVGYELFPVSDVTGTVVSTVGLPPKYLHAGVIVHNRLYHFNQSGIEISKQMAKNYKILKAKSSENKYQLSDRTALELEEWCNLQSRTDYGNDSYNVSNRNCLCFTRDICEFLGISFHILQIEKLRDWLANSRFAEKILEQLRKSPVLKELHSYSYSNRVGVVESKVEVVGLVVTALSVDVELMEKYRLSNSGGLYEIQDGSVPV